MVTGFRYTNCPYFGPLSWFCRCKEHSWPLSPELGLFIVLVVHDWGLGSLSWFGYCHWSLLNPCSKFWLSILILNVQRKSMSFKSGFGALVGAGGSWLGFGILILIWIWSLVFDTPIFQILVSILILKSKELEVPDWSSASRSWFGHSQWSLIHPCSKF